MCSILDFSKIFDELGGEITCAPKKRLSGRGGQHSDFGCSSVAFPGDLFGMKTLLFGSFV